MGSDVTAHQRSVIALPADVLDTLELTHSVQLALWAAVVDSTDDAIVCKTLDGMICAWNAAAERIFGYGAAEIVGEPILKLIPPELHPQEDMLLAKLRRGERIEHYETTRLTKDGRRIEVSITVSPIRDAKGNIVAASKIARELGERKQAERARAQLAAIVESSDDAIIGASNIARDISERKHVEEFLATETEALATLNEFSSRLWRCRHLNEGLKEILDAVIALMDADKGDIQLLDPSSQTLSIAAHRGFDQRCLEYFREVDATGDSACGRALRSSKQIVIEDIESDEQYAPMRVIARHCGYRSVIATPLTNVAGTRFGVVSTHFGAPHRPTLQQLRRLDLYARQACDFIQRCAIEDRLRQSENALKEADRRKDEFLALLAHELRNPLAPIRYALAVVNKREHTREQQQHAYEVIARQVSHMSRLLDDLLDVSRITRGKLHLKMTYTELTSVIGTAIEAARPILDNKQHALTIRLPATAVRLHADPVRLAQVFSNLLINSAKYTNPGGKIELSAATEGDDVVVRVRDNGVGIAPQVMPKLFTIFMQADNSVRQSEGGLGVGLSLVKGITELHGGTVEGHSDGPGCGSEFIVRLPLSGSIPTQPRANAVDRSCSSQELKVLIVDDNRDAASTCKMLLELAGHDVRMADTGLRALELVEEFGPQVLLLDIGLPDMSGYDVAEKIRSTSWGRNLTLVAITGWGQDEDKRRALAAGFDHHLTKPIAAQTLESLLAAIGGHH